MHNNGLLLALSMKLLLGLMNARMMSVHEVDVRMSMGIRVPSGCLLESL
jgi:hypothetical protein